MENNFAKRQIDNSHGMHMYVHTALLQTDMHALWTMVGTCSTSIGARLHHYHHALLLYILCPRLVQSQNSKKCYSTCHIECLRFMHRALNGDEKKTNCTVWWEIARRTF